MWWLNALRKMTLISTTPYTCIYVHHSHTDRVALDVVRTATAARKCVDLNVIVYYAAAQNLFYGCGNVPQTTAESSDTAPIHCTQCAAIRRYVHEYALVGRAWLYPRVNVANTAHLSKHHNYCLQSQNRGRKDMPHASHQIAYDRDK